MYIFVYNTPNGERFDIIEGYDFKHAARNFYLKMVKYFNRSNALSEGLFKELIRNKDNKLIIKTVECMIGYIEIRAIYSGDAYYKKEEESNER